MRLRTSLWILAFATAIPLVSFALLAANVVVEQENDSLVKVAKARNRATLSAIEGEVRDAIHTLQALSVAPSLEQNDLQAFHALGKEVLATQPSWNNLLVHDREGRQLLNASLPWGSTLLANPVAPDSLVKAVANGQPAVDDLPIAPLLKNRLGIPVRVPVIRDGKVAFVLTAVLAPEAFQQLLAAQEQPSGWVSGLVDGKGRMIARVPAVPTGDMASKDYLAHISDGAPEGWYRGRTLEGKDSFTAFARSGLTGWTIGYAIPAPLVTSGYERGAWLVALGIALSFAAAGGVGLWLARRIAAPMSQLATAAGAIGTGSVPPKVDSIIDEVAALSRAIGRAATDLAERDRSLAQSERELRQQAAELQRANANKTQFLALLSHELRNPLAPLRNGLAILKMRPTYDRAGETQAMMERQVLHMTRLIDDLLDVSRIDRGVLELRRERTPIDTVVSNAVETVKPSLEAKQQQLVIRYAPEPLYVDGDPVRLSQIVSNLLNNASKFTPVGGHVEVATQPDGDELVITVADDGIGFSESDKRRIFDMFVQLDGSRSQAAGGLGIGLTIVRSLVQMHGGRIEAESGGTHQGALFTVRLPKASNASAPFAPQTLELARTSGRRVLVVDDNVDAANSLSDMLKLNGYQVVACYDGPSALEAARALRPEVAFVDLNMPRMSGLDLARALRAQPFAERLRLVAVTGMGQPSDIESTRAAGFDAHLTKPASPEEILRLASVEQGNVIPLRADRQASGPGS